MRAPLLDAIRAARELVAVLPPRGVIQARADALIAALSLLASEAAPTMDPIRIVRLDDAGAPVAVAAAVPTVDTRPPKARRCRRPRPAAIEVEVMPAPAPITLEQHPEDPVSPLAARFAGLWVRS